MVKIGDKVKFLDNSYSSESFGEGKIGTVVTKYGDNLYEVRAEQGAQRGRAYSFYPREFEVLPIQIGDIVKYKDAISSYHTGTLRVLEIYNLGLSGVNVEDINTGFGFYISVDTAEKVEYTKFNVGDKVRIVKSPYVSMVQGDTGTIRSIDVVAHRGTIEVKNDKNTLTFKENELELLKEEKDMTTTEAFKVGDRVQRTDGSWKGMRIGDIATVTGIGDPLPGDLSFDEYGNGHSARKFKKVGFSEGDILERDGWYASEYLRVLLVTKYGYITTEYADEVSEIDDTDVSSELLPLNDTYHKLYVEEKEKVREYTLSEIAEKLDVPVAELRIKE